MIEATHNLAAWIGKRETREDTITPVPMAALAATLDIAVGFPKEGTELPPLWHWLYFLPLYRQSEVGPDGHAFRGGFRPPVPLPRRMWAGGRFKFVRPLRVGDVVRRESTIVDVTSKSGRSGALCFVLVRHEIFGPSGLALTEEHDIVYRDLPEDGAPSASVTPAPTNASFSRTIVPDDVLLFRYSALTFNGHRIHYDRRYVTEVEGYPGLIVHGPLIATLLAGLASGQAPNVEMEEFSFRAYSPVFDVAPFQICGQPDAVESNKIQVWAETPERNLAMHATATLRKR